MTDREVFETDLRRFNAALTPWVLTFDDGWQGIDPAAPESLTRPYRLLLSYGYANGLLPREE